MQFMSVKAAPQMFLFQPTGDHPRTSWFHNHLHDLKSLWWVAVWMVFYHHFHHSNEPLPGLGEMELCIQESPTLFPATMNDFNCLYMFQSTFLNVCDSLPGNKQPTVLSLDPIRVHLISDYKIVELTLPASINLHAAKDDIYGAFQEAFRHIKTKSPDYELLFIPNLIDAETAGKKCPRDESIRGSSSKRRQVA
jgi:hypothetical protein